MQARANLCRRAELALVVCAVRDQPSERGEAARTQSRSAAPGKRKWRSTHRRHTYVSARRSTIGR